LGPILATRRQLQSAHHIINGISRKNISNTTTDYSRTLSSLIPESLHSISVSANSTIKLSAIPRKLITLLPPPEPPWHRTPTKFIWNMKNTSANNQDVSFDLLLQDYSKEICCFTDGSKSTTRVGGSYVIDTEVSTFTLPPFSSAHTAEMMSIYQCLLALPTSHTSSFLICTDSGTALLKLQNSNTKCELTSHILFLLHHLHSAHVHITFVWVPAYRNIPGNEIAHQAARYSNSDTDFIPAIAPKDLNLHMSQLLNDQWLQKWLIQPSKLRTFKCDVQNWTRHIGAVSKSNRQLEVAINRVLLVHSCLTHSYLFEKTTPPVCSYCQQEHRITIISYHIPLHTLRRFPNHGLHYR